MSRARAWCFTINNPTDADRDACRDLECTYIVYGDEIGKEGTPHLQGYLELKDGKTLTALKKCLSKEAHLEKRKGTPEQASKYCKKEGRFIERGTISAQGKRNDLDEVAQLVKEGGVQAVVEQMPAMFVKYGRNIERLAELCLKPRDTKPKIVYLWGLTGVGKTYEACQGIDKDQLYLWRQPKGYWWNGYSQQQRVVIDEYHHDGSQADFRYMLGLLDEYPFQVQTKGGMMHFNSPEIYLTSEHPPEFWFADRPENELNQFLRRLTEVREVKSHDKEVVFEDELAFEDDLDNVD